LVFLGGDLLDLLTKVGRFSEHEARRYFSEVLAALMHLHQKRIAHRDIKLDNLGLALGADRQWHVKLLDFGFSDSYDPETRMTLSCGTLEYGNESESFGAVALF
jgi:MAP/microtubule affinity-regulating kinase